MAREAKIGSSELGVRNEESTIHLLICYRRLAFKAPPVVPLANGDINSPLRFGEGPGRGRTSMDNFE